MVEYKFVPRRAHQHHTIIFQNDSMHMKTRVIVLWLVTGRQTRSPAARMNSSSLFPTERAPGLPHNCSTSTPTPAAGRDTDNRCAIFTFTNALIFMVLTWVLALSMIAFQFLVLYPFSGLHHFQCDHEALLYNRILASNLFHLVGSLRLRTKVCLTAPQLKNG